MYPRRLRHNSSIYKAMSMNTARNALSTSIKTGEALRRNIPIEKAARLIMHFFHSTGVMRNDMCKLS